MKMLRNICAVVFVMIVAYVLCGCCFYYGPELNSNIEVTTCISPSMEPLIMTNGLIITDTSFPFEEVVEGDIILFEAGIGRYVNHRVHQVTELNGKKAVMTVGDNNMMVDDWVTTEEEYIGKIVFNTNVFKPMIDLFCGAVDINSNEISWVGSVIFAFVVVVLGFVGFWEKIKSKILKK